jgi:hypothetical protein
MPDPKHIIDEMRLLRNEDLLHLARNTAAAHRRAAVQVLVERGSEHAGHPEIADIASGIIHSNPAILKQANPAMSAGAHKLPGLLDIVAGLKSRIDALEARASQLESCTDPDLSSILADIEELKARPILPAKKPWWNFWS